MTDIKKSSLEQFQINIPNFREKELFGVEETLKVKGREITPSEFWKRHIKLLGVLMLGSSLIYLSIVLWLADNYVQWAWDYCISIINTLIGMYLDLIL